MENGLVQVYWGNGKGKTSAALGIAARALGTGYKVHLIQFMKADFKNDSEIPGEIRTLSAFPNFTYERLGLKEWYLPGENEAPHKRMAEEALIRVQKALRGGYDVIIADEILYALQFCLLEEAQVKDLIRSKPKSVELILTGSHDPLPGIFELSDLVTEIKKHKHPYDKGIRARKGIDC